MPAINARYPGVAAPPVRLLPTNLAPAAVGALYRGPEQIVIGQREEDLAPVVLDFTENPLLMVFGDSKSGKTTLLRHIIRTIRETLYGRPGGLHACWIVGCTSSTSRCSRTTNTPPTSTGSRRR